MRQHVVVLFAVALGTLLGCSSTGSMQQSTGTDVSLASSNYRVIKAGARGDSHGFYLLGFIPIVSPSFADAKTELYESVGQSLEGRAVALANQTQDKSWLYLILFSIPRITLTADVVEFLDRASDE